MRSLFAAAGVGDVEVIAEPGVHPLSSPEDWWPAVLGTGYRGTVEHLNEADRERVRRENIDFVQRTSVRSVEANVIYAVAVRNHGGST